MRLESKPYNGMRNFTKPHLIEVMVEDTHFIYTGFA